MSNIQKLTIKPTNPPLKATFVTRNARPFSKAHPFSKTIPRSTTRAKFSLSDIPTLPEPVTHAVINFCVIYSTMNWLFYRNLRKSIEKKNEKDKKND